jgi:hypothetical protein
LRKSELGDPVIVVSGEFWYGWPHVFHGHIAAHHDRYRDIVYACWPGLESWVRLYFWLQQLEWRYYMWLCRRGIWQTREEGGYFRDCKLAPARYWFRGRAPHWG